MRGSGLLLAVALLTGCGGSLGSMGIAGEPVYECGSLTFTADELAAAPAATKLGDHGQAALKGHGVEPINISDGWRLLAETDSELELIRELDQPQASGPGDVRTHEFVRAETISGTTNLPDGAWMLDAHGICTPRLDLGELGPADLALAEPLSPQTRQLELEVYERACASGQAADDRIEIVEQEVSGDQLRLVVGVRPLDGVQNCPGNPPTPLSIRLDEPLGDRVVVDASTLPPLTLEPSPTTTADERHQVAIEQALAYEPPGSYVMDVEVICFCPAGRYRVTVVDGVKTDVRHVDPNGDQPTDEPVQHPDIAPTLADIQQQLRGTTKSGAVTEIAVEDDGRPVVLHLDPMLHSDDDEIGFVITEWQPAS